MLETFKKQIKEAILSGKTTDYAVNDDLDEYEVEVFDEDIALNAVMKVIEDRVNMSFIKLSSNQND